jgi:hypothetical protein
MLVFIALVLAAHIVTVLILTRRSVVKATDSVAPGQA